MKPDISNVRIQEKPRHGPKIQSLAMLSHCLGD